MGQARTAFGQPFQAYGGQLVAGMNPLFNQSVAGGLGAIPGQQAAWNPLTQGMGAQAGILQNMALHPEQFQYNANDPVMQQQLQALNQQYDFARQAGMTQLGGSMGSAFGRGSRQSVAEGSLMSQLGIGQAGAAANLANQQQQFQYQRFVQQQQQRAALAGQNVQMGMMGLGQQQALGQYGTGLGMQAGDYARNVQQQGLNAQYGEFMRGQNWNQQQALGAAQAGGALLPFAGRTTTMSQQSDPFGQILGAGLALGGPAMSQWLNTQLNGPEQSSYMPSPYMAGGFYGGSGPGGGLGWGR